MMPEEFYTHIAVLLGEPHEYIQPPREGAKKRWGPRTPGNGRFPGRGLVRFFSNTSIHVALTSPNVSGWFKSVEEAVAAITVALDTPCQEC